MFDVIPGMRNREFTPDQQELVFAIKKDESEESLWDSFQTYWRERCANNYDLSDYDTWDVLDGYAREMFGRSEQYRVREYMKEAYRKQKGISAREMAEIYLLVIFLMQIRYDDREQVI